MICETITMRKDNKLFVFRSISCHSGEVAKLLANAATAAASKTAVKMASLKKCFLSPQKPSCE